MNAATERLLGHFARDWLGRSFVWGKSDCTVLALSWADALLRADRFVPQVLGKYHDEASAIAFAKSAPDPGASLVEAGFKRLDGPHLPTGSIILAPTEDYTLAFVKLPSKILTASESAGVILVPRRLLPETREVFRWA